MVVLDLRVLRFNTSLRQLQREIEVTYKTTHRRVARFAIAAIDTQPVEDSLSTSQSIVS